MMKNIAKSITSIFLLFLFSGCATLFTGTSDDIYFNSNPPGADIYIGGLKVGKTPATVTVKRPGFNDKEVTITLEGYEKRTFILKKSFNAVSILNLGGILGWIIDFATGSIFKYQPKSYEIDLEPTSLKIEDLQKDVYGRYEIPAFDNRVVVVDNELGIKIVFE